MKTVLKNSIYRVICCILTCSLLIGCGAGNRAADSDMSTTRQEKSEEADISDSINETAKDEKVDNINLWYTNDELTLYLTDCAIHFREANGVGVNLKLVSSVDYVESIYKGTKEGNGADVYILNTESLEKAYLLGMAAENKDVNICNSYNYPQVALDASTYKGRLIGYPFYYDTTFFLYNKDYVEAPEKFSDIVEFSNNYMGEYEKISTILQWDVHDLFFSYSFVGNYLNFGGTCGDNASIIDIDNAEVIEALTYFKQINQALYFDAADSDYNDVLKDFLAGKILYTMGSTANLDEIIKSGINYGICTIPALNDELASKAVSINYAAVVNPYASNKDYATQLAQWITFGHAGEFYSYTKKLPSRRLASYPNEEWQHIAEQYENTAILPKLMAATNYWLELEVTLNTIWDKELDEETTIDIDAGLSDDEQMALKQAYIAGIIREYVTGEIGKLQTLMEEQIN